jgi:hypothetical protein
MSFLRFCAVAIVTAAVLAAGPIAGLVSTGINVSGNQDQNWQVTLPNTTTQQAYRTDANDFPFGYWAANDANSSWISPQAGYYGIYASNTDVAGAAYTFTTTFNLSSPDAWFSMRMMGDNKVASVELNGVDLGFEYLVGQVESLASMQQWSPVFTVTGGFQSGLNTLAFNVLNGPTGDTWNPAGLRVEILDSSQAPEPSTFAMLALGAGLLGLGAWRRRR